MTCPQCKGQTRNQAVGSTCPTCDVWFPGDVLCLWPASKILSKEIGIVMNDTRTRTARVKIGRHTPQVYWFLSKAFEHETEGKALLDFGCGYGQGREPLEAAGWEWHGTDLLQRVEHPRFIPLEELCCHRESFHVVALSNVVNVQTNKNQLFSLISSAAHVLRDNGWLVWNLPGTPRYMPEYSLSDTRLLVREALHKYGYEVLAQEHRLSLTCYQIKRIERDGHGR